MGESGSSRSLFTFDVSRSSYWTSGVRKEVLGNGLTLLVQPDHSAPVVAVVTHVKAGFFDEPDRWTGISHVLEHMFFKGTATRGVGAIARETKSAGGYLNASTSYDHTSYFAVLPAASLAPALEIQADALLRVELLKGVPVCPDVRIDRFAREPSAGRAAPRELHHRLPT